MAPTRSGTHSTVPARDLPRHLPSLLLGESFAIYQYDFSIQINILNVFRLDFHRSKSPNQANSKRFLDLWETMIGTF